MRTGILRPLLSTLYRAPQSRPSPPCLITSLPNFFTSSRTLANIRPDHDLFINVAFTPDSHPRQQSELGQRPEIPPPDARTLKLGKSMISPSRFSRPKSPCTSSLRPTPTSRPSPAVSPTMPPSGPRQ
ncbi:MAG: hypothetical protein LQ340_006513 [Diploschistes diacapsis]|nr:MAG: hypothetical protein LQ340_006513 [Diploschistes diacapsis]